MNRQILLLRDIYDNNKATQRALCKSTGLALGTVNTLIKEAISDGYIVQDSKKGYELSETGRERLKPLLMRIFITALDLSLMS